MRPSRNVSIMASVGLLAIALVGVAWFDLATGGEAKQAPFIGTIGAPQRGVYIAPTSTPVGLPTVARPTVQAQPAPATAKGTPAERDQQRRVDLLVLVKAASKYKDDKGSLPTTDAHVQSLCTYKELDQGCKFAAYTDTGELPADPVRDGFNYWYSSDGKTAGFYASLEEPLQADEQPCDTNDAELVKHANVICVSAP